MVELPWKENCPNLPTNYSLARSRLSSVLSTLRRNPEELQCYNKVIEEQLSLGFIEKVEESASQSIVHYLPHHAIRKQSKTTPLRIVYDCSAKISKCSPSLNDCLYSGPSLINELCDILLRFRLHSYVCSADIAKAFLNVGIKVYDRDTTRFLWPTDPTDQNSEITEYRFKSVLFGSTCSQFLLNATLRHHLQQRKNSVSSNYR